MTIREFADFLEKNFTGTEELTSVFESGNNPDGSIAVLNINDLFDMAIAEEEENG